MSGQQGDTPRRGDGSRGPEAKPRGNALEAALATPASAVQDDVNASPLVRRVLQFAVLMVISAAVVLLAVLWSLL